MKKVLLPIAVLAAGAAVTLLLIRMRPEIEKVAQEVPPPIVRVLEVEPADLRLDVESQGTVVPETEADLVAEVSGTVIRVSPSFQEGAFFRQGEVLLELDRRDYELNVASARASISQAMVALEREQAEAEVAREEWRELGEGDPGPLVLREPQLDEARARIEAARAALQKAELDLERTVIKAPFAGRVRSKRVDLGEFVNRGGPLATIYSTESAEIRLPVPDADLAYLDLALGAERREGPAVTLEADFAGARHAWQGRVVRVGGEIDPRSRMVPLIARVDAPYRSAGDRPPLSIGLFVRASIQGREVENVFEIPRSAVRGQNTVLLVDDESRLQSRTIGILRATSDRLIVERGLEAGDRICLTPLDSMFDGMVVEPSVTAGERAFEVETGG